MRRKAALIATASMLVPLIAHAATCPAARIEWFVKPNGTQLTRPAYTLKDGALVKSKERAPVGATCDTRNWPTKPSNKDLYASYDSTSLVALCTKR